MKKPQLRFKTADLKNTKFSNNQKIFSKFVYKYNINKWRKNENRTRKNNTQFAKMRI